MAVLISRKNERVVAEVTFEKRTFIRVDRVHVRCVRDNLLAELKALKIDRIIISGENTIPVGVLHVPAAGVGQSIN